MFGATWLTWWVTLSLHHVRHLRHRAHYVKRWHHPQSQKYSAGPPRRRPSYYHRQHAQKIWRDLDVWFLRYASGQTDRQTDSSQYCECRKWLLHVGWPCGLSRGQDGVGGCGSGAWCRRRRELWHHLWPFISRWLSLSGHSHFTTRRRLRLPATSHLLPTQTSGTSTFSYLVRLACLPKGLYILRRVWDVSEFIAVVVSQIITKFGECVG